MKKIACIIARTNSKRLKQKVLKKIHGVRLIEYIIRKIKRSRSIDKIYLCTSVEREDKVLLDIAKSNGIEGYAGSPELVIERMLEVARIEHADHLVRITGDNIFTDEVYLDLMFKFHLKNDMDYTRTEYLPLGVTPEIISRKALERVYGQIDPKFSEYLMIYCFRPDVYRCQVLVPPKPHRREAWSLTVDTPADWERTLAIIGSNNRLLDYDKVVKICNGKKIPNLSFRAKGSVKLPAEVVLSYDCFRMEMECRIKKARRLAITMKEYKEMQRVQDI